MKKTKRGSNQSADADGGGRDNLHFQNRVRELELENESFQQSADGAICGWRPHEIPSKMHFKEKESNKEIQQLRDKLANASPTPIDNAQKLEEEHLQKLTALEDQVADLRNKLEIKSQFSVRRSRGDEATKQLQYEIQSLKTQKVQLQCKLKVESLQFRLCKALLEKEVHQVKREGRRNQFELRKLLDSNERLKMVLQRKTVEASMNAKRLKELLESRKGSRNRDNPILQGLARELEVTGQLNELCSEYERQIEVMAEENAKLKEEMDVLKDENLNLRCLSQDKTSHSLEEDPEILELKEQVLNLGGLVRQLKLQKAELDRGNNSQNGSSHISVSLTKSDLSVKNINTSGSKHSKPSNVSKNKSASSICCSCGKRALCRTTKCKCRHMGGSCGTSCGCAASKCTNREASPIQLNDSPESQISEAKTDSSTIVGTVKGTIYASQGEVAPAEKIDNIGFEPNKKPLSDIGNIRLRSTRKNA